MKYLWWCEIKKLIFNKNFALVTIFFGGLIVGLQVMQFYLPIQDNITAKEFTACYESYKGCENLDEQIIVRLDRLECREDVEQLSVLTGGLRETMLENLIEKWDLTEEQLLEMEEPLLYCDNTADEISLLKTFYGYVEQMNYYRDYVQEVVARGKFMQEATLYKEDAYALLVAEKTSQRYRTLSGLQLDVVNYLGIERSVGNWMNDVLCFLFYCMSCMFIFQVDKECGAA